MTSWREIGLIAALAVSVAACGDSDDKGGINQRCVTEAGYCQLTDGVTTKQQAQALLGPPSVSQSSTGGGTTFEQWLYVCMPDQQSAQEIQLVFDGNGVLMFHQALSTGPNAPPLPTCP